ncbi:MAG: phosphatase PAP2 family protein [Acidobacteriia bacterium]|nr:phosphatase PAP2 family protein [Terriglobia bacterium]
MRNLEFDQKQFWTTPLRIRESHLEWLLPITIGTAGLVASDTALERHLPTGASTIQRSRNVSDFGVAALLATGGGSYLWGVTTGNSERRLTGLLTGEAVVNSLLVTEALNLATGRQRPNEGDGRGRFWVGGNSFPSGHAAIAWSAATVLAHRYENPFAKLLAYATAATVSATRVTGGKHFTSDALIGSALGWYIGRQVYLAHSHAADADMANWGTFEKASGEGQVRDAENMGSSYVPLDNWVYPAFDRLAGLGYVPTAFLGLRPWTRMECARLLDEAAGGIESDPGSTYGEAFRLLQALQTEFLVESHRLEGGSNVSAELESIYTRFTGITGKPLNDSFHVGQTIINDYGRPYQQGFNMVTGFTSHAEAGPLAFYVRGEYQHSPSAPAYPLSVRNAIGVMDSNPVQPATPFAARDDFQLLDTYVALNIKNNQISFGRQSIWWGPGPGGALMFTDNALPMYMLRWTRVSPTKLPSFLGVLGPMRTESFLGKLEGHHFPADPYISGQKVSFKPTENLEFGFSKITIFAGGNTPLTLHTFLKATFSTGAGSGNANANAPGVDPGDRRGGFDFSYRLPGLRKWLTLYSDSLADDDPSPLAAPRRAAFNPGIYLSHVPRLPKLDLRVEAVNTDTSTSRSVGGEFFYINNNYHDSHTNAGNIMGSWIGREGHGLQASSTYWLSPRNTILVGYRKAWIDRDFVPGGGVLDDISVRSELVLRPDLFVKSALQIERWNFPLLASHVQTNVTASVQLTYQPSWRLRKRDR